MTPSRSRRRRATSNTRSPAGSTSARPTRWPALTWFAFTTNEAQQQFNLVGKYQQIPVKVAEGADKTEVQQAIAAELPAGVEVVPTDQVVKESQDNLSGIINTFGTVLLAFAGISLFVAAFLIFNVFLIVVGQRVRELALLRPSGPPGARSRGRCCSRASRLVWSHR